MKANIFLVCVEGLLRTFGDVLHVMSMLVLLFKIRNTRSCSGISLKSQILYISVYIWRYVDLIYIFIYPNVVFRSVRMVYNTIMKISFISLQGYIIYNIVYNFYYTYDAEFDDTSLWALITPVLIGGAFLARVPKGASLYFLKLVLDWLWASSILLESISIVPQLVLLQKVGEGETLTIYYIVFMGLYRVFYIFAWIVKWINTKSLSHMLLLSSVVQTLLYSNFFMVYINAFLAKGKTVRVNPVVFIKEAFGVKETRRATA